MDPEQIPYEDEIDPGFWNHVHVRLEILIASLSQGRKIKEEHGKFHEQQSSATCINLSIPQRPILLQGHHHDFPPLKLSANSQSNQVMSVH